MAWDVLSWDVLSYILNVLMSSICYDKQIFSQLSQCILMICRSWQLFSSAVNPLKQFGTRSGP